MMNINHKFFRIRNGFWGNQQQLIRSTTIPAIYNRFFETGRFEALKCQWVEGNGQEPHFFFDSDAAKWIESAAYAMQGEPEPDLYKKARSAIDSILSNAEDTGYFNSYYMTHDLERFTYRENHELYCAGHLMEAAVAWYDATGESDFLNAMCTYADYIEKVFKIDQSAAYVTPGHPEIELALVRLAQTVHEPRYMELAKWFIDQHGCNEKEKGKTLYPPVSILYNQDDIPLRKRSKADGHSVRALYLFSGMADVALYFHDPELTEACKRCFDNIIFRRMYITGGVGSSRWAEAFSLDYDLPNRTSYAESCAAVALVLFAGRMQQLLPADRKWADTIERVLYNGILSGISLDGDKFFYENPLEINPGFNNDHPAASTTDSSYPITQRQKTFKCCCCPPNITRLIASVGDYICSQGEDILYVHQYIDSIMQQDSLKLEIATRYPSDGTVSISLSGTQKSKIKKLALRIPGWCNSFTLSNCYELRNGYAYIDADKDISVTFTMDMPVVTVSANPRVPADSGCIAVTRGPVVYCMEAKDNGSDLAAIRLDADAVFSLMPAETCFDKNVPSLPLLQADAWRVAENDALYFPTSVRRFRKIKATMIPYYTFANRGETEMRVWIPEK